MFGVLPLTCVYYLRWRFCHTGYNTRLEPAADLCIQGMRALPLMDRVFQIDLMMQVPGDQRAVLFAASFAIFLALLKSARRHGSLIQGGE